MASIAAFVYFWSSAYEVSGGCATDTVYPSFVRMFATASHPEPSAKAPCTRTTFLICCFTIILLCSKDLIGLLLCRKRPPYKADVYSCFTKVAPVTALGVLLVVHAPAASIPLCMANSVGSRSLPTDTC